MAARYIQEWVDAMEPSCIDFLPTGYVGRKAIRLDREFLRGEHYI